jgi:hypothetical protein
MPNICRRPMSLAAGTVRSVPMRPPRLKAFVPVAFQPSTSARAAAGARPWVLACTWASPAATMGMKALTPHQAMRAMTAIEKPLRVSARMPGRTAR